MTEPTHTTPIASGTPASTSQAWCSPVVISARIKSFLLRTDTEKQPQTLFKICCCTPWATPTPSPEPPGVIGNKILPHLFSGKRPSSSPIAVGWEMVNLFPEPWTSHVRFLERSLWRGKGEGATEIKFRLVRGSRVEKAPQTCEMQLFPAPREWR